jgi:hypothetical protein
MMGIEYEGYFHAPLSEERIPEVVEAITNLPGIEVVGKPSIDTLNLRFLKGTRTEGWSEDIFIKINSGMFYVLFHTGNSRQREVLLQHLLAILEANHIVTTFEEM